MKPLDVAGAAAVGFAAGIALASIPKASASPQVRPLGTFKFVDETALATVVMTVVDGAGRKYIPAFLRQGFESGGAHYIWAFDWAFNNPGEITVDAGLIADLWVRPASAWAIQLSNFDYQNPKVVIFEDGVGGYAQIPVDTSNVFLALTQTLV